MGDDMPISSKIPPKLPATTGTESTTESGNAVIPGDSTAGFDVGGSLVQEASIGGSSSKIKVLIGETEAVVNSGKNIELDSYKNSTQGAISAEGGKFFNKGFGTF